MKYEPGLWLAGLAATRLGVLLAEPERLHRIDELYAGAAALEWLAGRGQDPAAAAWDPYAGGSIAIIAAATAVFRLLGPGLAGFHAIAVATAAATCGLWLALLDRAAGRSAMRLAGLLFVVAPLEVARLDLISWGNHRESALPAAAALLVLLALTGDGPVLRAGVAATRPRATSLALVGGLLASLGVFFSLLAAIVPATLVIVFLVLGRDALPRRAAVAALVGFGAGGLPWLWFNQARGFAGFVELGDALTPRPTAFAGKLLGLATTHLAGLLGSSIPWLAVVLVVALAVLRSVRAARPGRLPLESVLLVLLALFAAAFAVAGFDISPVDTGVIRYRYLAPLWPYIVALVALALTRLPKRVAWGLAALIAAPGAIDHLRLVPDWNSAVLARSGVSYQAYGWHLSDRDDAVARCDAISDEASRRAARFGHAIGLTMQHRIAAWAAADAGHASNLARFLDAVPERTPRPYAERAALVLRAPGGWRLDRAGFDQVLAALAASGLPDDSVASLTAAAVVGFGRAGGSVAAPTRPGGDDGVGMWRAMRGAGTTADATPAERRGYAQQWAWARLTGGERVEPPPTGDGAAEGIDHALWLFEPDDPARRAWLRDERLR